MPIAVRSAETTWNDSLAKGSGSIKGNSGALDLPVTWASRTEEPGGKTSPEELIAAAHSSCFSMALALLLGENKTPPTQLRVESAVTLDEVDGKPTITTADVKVSGQAEGLDADGFKKVVDQAAALCPVSRLMSGAQINVEVVD